MAWPRWTVVIAVLAGALMPGRALGVAPAAPDSSSLRATDPAGYVFPSPRVQFRAWASNAVGPSAIAGNLVGASWRHWVTDEPAEWDTDGRGFGRRFGAGSLTTFVSETSLSLSMAAMRQDAQYYRSPRDGFGPRLWHAASMTVMARDRSGAARFSPGKTLAPFVGPVVTTTTLYPARYTYADGLLSGAYSLLLNAGWNVAREFILPAPRWNGGPGSTR